jgi:hypothetical protein
LLFFSAPISFANQIHLFQKCDFFADKISRIIGPSYDELRDNGLFAAQGDVLSMENHPSHLTDGNSTNLTCPQSVSGKRGWSWLSSVIEDQPAGPFIEIDHAIAEMIIQDSL